MACKSKLAHDRVDADRIARTGGRRPGERSVNGELAKRLSGFRNRSRPRASGTFGARQRVVVKALVSRHKPGKARGSIARHASYLGRESASADGKPGVFYDNANQNVNARQVVAGWAEDRHHFRLIVSPEHGEDIPDMTAYVREVMRRVERDLDAGKLDWIAVNHHNTDNPHAHVMLRGRRTDGADLVILRRYISQGIRDRASEVATELLGPRSAQEVRTAKVKEVEAERFTSLDRMIERHVQDGQIDVAPSRHIGFGTDDRRLVVARLQFLQQLDLARKGRGTRWQVEPDFRRVLRELGTRNDIIKQLYARLGNEAGRVQQMNGTGVTSVPVSGVVIALGSIDEIGSDRYVVVRDKAGQSHYGRVRDGEAYRDLAIGSVAELGGLSHRRERVTRQILAVARANAGTYSTQCHETLLRGTESDVTEDQTALVVRSAAGRLRFAADAEGSGVRAQDDCGYAVDPSAFETFSRRTTQRTDVRVIASHPLAQQVQAEAYTWLDRQAFGTTPDSSVHDHPAVVGAIEQRQEWLLAHGYAHRATPDGPLTLHPNAARELARAERNYTVNNLTQRYGRPVNELAVGETATGKFCGTEHLHRGRLAVVVGDEQVTLTPVAREPDVARGSRVEAERNSRTGTRIETFAGQALGRQAASDIAQLEAGR